MSGSLPAPGRAHGARVPCQATFHADTVSHDIAVLHKLKSLYHLVTNCWRCLFLGLTDMSVNGGSGHVPSPQQQHFLAAFEALSGR